MFDNSLIGTISEDGSSQAGTSSTSEQTVKSFTLKANELKTGQRLKIKAFGHGAANTHNKAMALYFGSTSVSTGTTTGSGDVWELSMEIIANSPSSQAILANASDSATGGLAKTSTAATQDLTMDTLIKVTVTGGTTGADCNVDGLTIEQAMAA